MPDDKVDDFINKSAAGYRAEGRPPADEMWAAIQDDVAEAISPTRRSRFARSIWLTAAAALAATLVIGVGLGRMSAAKKAASVAAADLLTSQDSARIAAHQLSTVFKYLGETEVFLAGVNADLRAGRGDADRQERSRLLLARTRLLLGTEGQSPTVNRLLQDLELLLAEIACLPDSAHAADASLVQETLRRNNILPRIRTTLPAKVAGL